MIHTADTLLAPIARDAPPHVPLLEAVRDRLWRTDAPKPTSALAIGVVVKARVNHGRWLANCPWCGGGELVTPTDLRFCCFSCGHRGTPAEGAWIRVEFPEARAAIEAALEHRPPRNQNWEPDEPVEKLEAENCGERRWLAVLAHRAGEITGVELDRLYEETSEARDRLDDALRSAPPLPVPTPPPAPVAPPSIPGGR